MELIPCFEVSMTKQWWNSDGYPDLGCQHRGRHREGHCVGNEAPLLWPRSLFLMFSQTSTQFSCRDLKHLRRVSLAGTAWYTEAAHIPRFAVCEKLRLHICLQARLRAASSVMLQLATKRTYQARNAEDFLAAVVRQATRLPQRAAAVDSTQIASPYLDAESAAPGHAPTAALAVACLQNPSNVQKSDCH